MQPVKTKNALKRCEIFRIIDNPENQKIIRQFRKKWNIKELLDPKEYKISEFGKKLLSDNPSKEWEDFLEEIKSFRLKVGKDKKYQNLFIFIIGFSEIPDNALKPCYLKTEKTGEGITQTSIIVYPFTTDKDIRKELRNIKKDLKKHDKEDLTGLGWNYDPYLEDFDTKKLNAFEIGRKLYYIKYKDVFEGKTKQPKNIDTIATAWLHKCPAEFNHNSLKEERSCPYCSMYEEDILRKLNEYETLVTS